MDQHLQTILINLGWAFLAGLLILMVPLTYRKAKYAENTTRRIIAIVAMLIFLGAFCGLSCWLWQTRIPADDSNAAGEPAPVVEPVPVVEPR